jgi:hypothetical protein
MTDKETIEETSKIKHKWKTSNLHILLLHISILKERWEVF